MNVFAFDIFYFFKFFFRFSSYGFMEKDTCLLASASLRYPTYLQWSEVRRRPETCEIAESFVKKCQSYKEAEEGEVLIN